MRRLGCILLVGCLLLAVGVEPARAELSDEEAKRRLLRVKKRTRDYLVSLRGLVIRCAPCNGTGKLIWYGTGGRGSRPCTTCEGRKKRLSPKKYAFLYYELMSPAYRDQRGLRQAIEAQRAQVERTRFPAVVSRTYLKGAELMDDTHAKAWIRIGADATKRPLHWVWAVAKGQKRGDWYLYHPKFDGPWPGSKEHALVDPGVALTGGELGEVKAALGTVKLQQQVVGWRKIKRTLVLQLEPGPSGLASSAIQHDAIAIVRAIWPAQPVWTGVRLDFDGPFKNKYGLIELKPYGCAHMEQETFGKIVWQNLTTPEVFALFETRWQSYPGWRLLIR